MSTLNLYPSKDGYLYCYSTTFATAAMGEGTLAPNSGATTMYVGQRLVSGDYRVYQGFIALDFSLLDPNADITDLTLRLKVSTDYSTDNFNVQLRAYNFGSEVNSGSWVGAGNSTLGEDLTACPICLTANTADISDGYLTLSVAPFGGLSNLLEAINFFGLTKFVLCSSYMAAGTAPVADQAIIFSTNEAAVNEDRPYATVTYTAGSASFGTPTPILTTAADVSYLRERITANPDWEPWTEFLASSRLTNAMAFVPGPTNTDYSRTNWICANLDAASRYAREAATAYACSGTSTYGTKARDILVYWANYEIDSVHVPPPTYETASAWYPTDDCYNYGFHMGWGCYAFALAYSIIRDTSICSVADRTLLDNYFYEWAVAEKSYALVWLSRNDYAFSRTTETQLYEWGLTDYQNYIYAEGANPLGLRNNIYDRYVAMDNPAGVLMAWYAACCACGLQSDKDSYLFNEDFPTNVHEMIYRATNARNDGDGVSGHPNPVPQVQVYKNSRQYTSPGCVTYMHFNARWHTLIYAMAVNEGKATTDEETYMNNMWDYLVRFDGVEGDHELSPQGALDTYTMDDMMGYLQLAAGILDHATAQAKISTYAKHDLIEVQSAGFTLLTAPSNVDYTPPDDGGDDDEEPVPGGGVGNEGVGYTDDLIEINEQYTLPWLVDQVHDRLDNFLELGKTDFDCDGSTTLFHLSDNNVNFSSLRVWHVPFDTGLKVELGKGSDWTEEWSDDWFSVNIPLSVGDRILTRYTYRHWSSTQVAQAINAGIDYLFPEFYRVSELDITAAGGITDYNLTDEANGIPIERVIEVEIYPCGSTKAYHLSPYHNYRIVRRLGREPMLRVFNVNDGDTLRVYYQRRNDHFPDPYQVVSHSKRPVSSYDNVTLEDLEMPNHITECLILYACWHLLASKTSSRVRADSPSVMRQEGISTAQEMMSQARLMKMILDIEVKKRRMPPITVLGV